MSHASLPADTECEVFRRQLARFREMTPLQRLELADQLSADVTELALIGIRAQHPEYGPAEVLAELVRRRYGKELASAAFPHAR